MKTDFILPDLGEGITECELVEWRVGEGDPVTEDQPVADVMTDKALVEITSMHDGVISRLYCRKGEIAEVGSPLFEIEVADEAAAGATGEDAGATAGAAGAGTPSPPTPMAGEQSAPPPARDAAPATPGRTLATPAVRRLARELNVDLNHIRGSGKEGRVLKEDLLPHGRDDTRAAMAEAGQAAAAPERSRAQPSGAAAHDRSEPIRGVRAAMARQMRDAASTIPHFTYSEEVDVTALEDLRRELRPVFRRQDIRLGPLPLVIKAIALAVRHYPILNSRVNDDCTELTYLADVNVGMATDTPLGLLVPTVKQAQDKSLLEIATDVQRLTDEARGGRLAQEDMQGGTISVSNIGALGGTVAAPIINKPEVAIVALGRMQSLPRFDDDGTVTARRIMQVSWSGDHRIIDGATMARFCNLWKGYLEAPGLMLTELR